MKATGIYLATVNIAKRLVGFCIHVGIVCIHTVISYCTADWDERLCNIGDITCACRTPRGLFNWFVAGCWSHSEGFSVFLSLP